jgi:hypothetical protein
VEDRQVVRVGLAAVGLELQTLPMDQQEQQIQVGAAVVVQEDLALIQVAQVL